MHPLYKQALSDWLIITINTNRVYFLKNGSQTLITYPISTINRLPCFNHVISCFSIALQCPYCRNEYDMQAIEQMLITNAQEKSMAFVLQDVACSKCQGVSVNYNNILCIVYLLFIFFQQSEDYRYQISCPVFLEEKITIPFSITVKPPLAIPTVGKLISPIYYAL